MAEWDRVERRKQQRRLDDGRRHGENNWTLLLKEYAPKFDFKYKDREGNEFSFFGLVHAEDDLYYGLIDKDGKVALASCVGSLDGEHGWYEQIPNGGRCGHCNCVYPVTGPIKCDRFRCPLGPNPLLPQHDAGGK